MVQTLPAEPTPTTDAVNFTTAIVFGPGKMTKSRATLPFLMAIMAIALYFCYLLVAPFLKPIIFSAILAIIFYPVQARIHRVIRNRHVSASTFYNRSDSTY